MRSRLKGSQTVEMALVMPTVLFVVVSILYFVFYIHDMVVLDACAHYSAIGGVFESHSAQHIAKENLNDITLLTINPSSTWTEGVVEVNVKYMGDFSIPFVGLRTFISEKKINVSASSYKTMKMRNMYITKVAKEIIGKDSE